MNMREAAVKAALVLESAYAQSAVSVQPLEKRKERKFDIRQRELLRMAVESIGSYTSDSNQRIQLQDSLDELFADLRPRVMLPSKKGYAPKIQFMSWFYCNQMNPGRSGSKAQPDSQQPYSWARTSDTDAVSLLFELLQAGFGDRFRKCPVCPEVFFAEHLGRKVCPEPKQCFAQRELERRKEPQKREYRRKYMAKYRRDNAGDQPAGRIKHRVESKRRTK
jgi:hypothetical protein